MPGKTSLKSKTAKPKSASKKSASVLDADKTRELEEKLAQREAELAVINSVQTALASKMDFQGIINAVGDKLSEIFEDGNVGIGLVDKARNVAVVPYVIENGKRLDYFEVSLDVPSIFQHLLKRRRPILINTKFRERFGGEAAITFPGRDQRDLKSWLSVPIINGDEFIGGISLRNWQRENAYTESDVHLLQTIANSMSVALENVRLFDETQRLLKETEQRAAELQIINNIGQTLTEGLDLQNTLERVGERLRDVLKIDSIGVVVFNPKSDLGTSYYLYIKGKRVTAEHFSFEKFRLGTRLSARGSGRSWVVNTNAEKIWQKFGAYRDDVAKSFVMFPLLAGREVIGGITIADYEKENAFIDLPISMLETIASNMGTAIQNVRLFDETERLLKETEQRATELQIINNIGQTLTEGGDLSNTIQRVGDRLREALKVENIGISVWDEKLEHIVAKYYYRNSKPASSETWMAGDVKTALRLAARGGGRSWIVNRNAEKSWQKFGGVNEVDAPKSFVQLPLLAGGKLVGGITIADYEKEDAFTDLSVGMLETISSNMGTAIQNARLFDETQRLLKETDQRATELQIINNIGQTLTESGDLESMIQRVGERIQEALNVNDIIISIFDKETERIIANYMVRNGEQTTLSKEDFNMHAFKIMMRASARRGGVSWVVKDDEVEKFWHRWKGSIGNDVPKSVVVLPLLAGREVIGGISLADYEKENAFTDLSLNLLETIASNMGTAVQNVRLFEETKRLFAEAEEARAVAEQANKAKSTFLANMSHELRTPLNAIMGFTQIVRGKGEGILPEKQLDNLDKVTSSSQHLLGLINTVLDIAKIEAGRMEALPSRFKLNDLADQCANLATPLLKPGVTLEKQVEESIGVIYSDQDKIKQIVLNLLSNAAKFTHEGKIILKVEKFNDETVSIAVKDSGIGISEEAVGRVFEEFQQADNTTTRQYGGTGLGLTISRNLARLLGGDLTATSKLGKGSTFTLTIPMHYKTESASSDPEPDTIHPAESHSAVGPAQAEKKMRLPTKTILVVEDTELNINLLAQLLEEEYKLFFAKDGAQGVDMAQREKPDLILMDISLPIMDGYEATRRIRTKMDMASIPIIGLSAYAMRGDEDKAKEAGCNDYITKPINKDILLQKIKEYLR
jgi:signal transduction histidine kinase/CheY-like chemotaxis protein/PAS domain-containing protein